MFSSVLNSLLFFLYTNDFPNYVKKDIALFADDAELMNVACKGTGYVKSLKLINKNTVLISAWRYHILQRRF